jgi:hypothetical protein
MNNQFLSTKDFLKLGLGFVSIYQCSYQSNKIKKINGLKGKHLIHYSLVAKYFNIAEIEILRQIN